MVAPSENSNRAASYLCLCKLVSVPGYSLTIRLLIILKARIAAEALVTGLAKENRELARMLSASIRIAQARGSQRTDDKRPLTNDKFFACGSSHCNPSGVGAAFIDAGESTLKIHSRQGDEITLTPIETKHHSPRKFHASRIAIQGVLVEIVRRSARRKR